MKTLVATIWAYPDRPIEDSPLWESCRRFGIPLYVSQRGQPYVHFTHNKIDLFFDELNRINWDYLIYVDADDAFFTRPPWGDSSLERARNNRLLISSEATCWPTPDRHEPLYPKSESACRYLNAGVWMASRSVWKAEFAALKEIARYTDSPSAKDDQYLFHERYTSGKSAIELDKTEAFCLNLNLHPQSERELFHRVLFGTAPLIVHGSGGAKGVVRELWKRYCRLSDVQTELRYDGEGGSINRDSEVPASLAVNHNRVTGLINLIRELPPLGRVVELGCWKGVSTEVWALAAEQVYAIDPWFVPESFRAFSGRLTPYPNVQAIRGFSHRCHQLFPDGSLDLVYIDAMHDKASVLQDITHWRPKVKPGGWLAGHDHMEFWNCGGVIEAVQESLGSPDRVFADNSWLVQIR